MNFGAKELNQAMCIEDALLQHVTGHLGGVLCSLFQSLLYTTRDSEEV